MSKIALSGNASGTGTLTIASPNTNTDYTLSLPTATTTLVGTDATQTLTNKTIDGSQLVAASVTSTQMATAVQPLGVGQTMTNVVGSRTSGTTYTNSTGRPITVYISAADSTNTMYAQVNSVVVYQSLSRSTYFNYLPICFIVPSGSTYVVANITYLASWVELR